MTNWVRTADRLPESEETMLLHDGEFWFEGHYDLQKSVFRYCNEYEDTWYDLPIAKVKFWAYVENPPND